MAVWLSHLGIGQADGDDLGLGCHHRRRQRGHPFDRNHVETGRPGARPHVTLENSAGGKISTVNLCSSTFALLTDDRSASSFAEASVPLAIVAIGRHGSHRDIDRPWHAAYGVARARAVLIRPDGYAAARFNVLPTDPARAVNDAVGTILGLHADSQGSACASYLCCSSPREMEVASAVS
jgi:hypothetical protein